jgi:hypothetical protein
MDATESPNQISAGNSLLRTVTFQSALILQFDKIEDPLLEARNYLVVRTGFASHLTRTPPFALPECTAHGACVTGICKQHDQP